MTDGKNIKDTKIWGTLIGGIVGTIVLFAVDGLVTKYAWNNVMVAIFGIQQLGFWQAAGVSSVFQLLVVGRNQMTDKSPMEVFFYHLLRYLVMWLLLSIVASQL